MHNYEEYAFCHYTQVVKSAITTVWCAKTLTIQMAQRHITKAVSGQLCITSILAVSYLKISFKTSRVVQYINYIQGVILMRMHELTFKTDILNTAGGDTLLACLTAME